MSQEKAPAFQFYVKEFLSDANQAGMSLQETGAYARLMCFEWNEQGKGLPDDPVRCARMVGATSAQMRRMWPALRPCFRPHADQDARIVHPRLQLEREKQAAYRRRQSDNGKRGGRPKVKPLETHDEPTANPVGVEREPTLKPEKALLSPISYLQKEKEIALDVPTYPTERTAEDDRIERFIHRYPGIYAKCRSNATFVVRQARDFDAFVDMVHREPSDERLDAMLELFLTVKGRDWLNTPGTPRQFLNLMPECDRLLRENGR